MKEKELHVVFHVFLEVSSATTTPTATGGELQIVVALLIDASNPFHKDLLLRAPGVFGIVAAVAGHAPVCRHTTSPA